MSTCVFAVHHVRRMEESGRDDYKLIGVYTTKPKAEAAIERAGSKKGFVDYPNGFQINEWVLNPKEWPNGFFIVYERGSK